MAKEGRIKHSVRSDRSLHNKVSSRINRSHHCTELVCVTTQSMFIALPFIVHVRTNMFI